MTDARPAAAPRPRKALLAYVAGLAGLGIALGAIAFRADLQPPGETAWAALPAFVGLLVAAEYLFVRFRFGGEVNALNLFEAVLAPLLFAFSAPVVMMTVAIAQAAGGILRRNAPIKAAFNVAQWTLAAGAGAAVLGALAGGRGVSWRTAVSLLVAMGVVGLVNQAAFTMVLAIANRRPPSKLLAGLAPIIPGWVAGFSTNVLTGLLLVMAYAAHPAAVALFPVPLAVLHLAYRGYAGARSDRVRLAGLPRAAQALAEPLDPMDAVEPYLREVARCFEASAAAMVIRTARGRRVYRLVTEGGGSFSTYEEKAGTPSLEGALAARPAASRLTVSSDDALAELLAATGWRDCLAAPLLESGQIMGALVLFDQAGLEGFEAGEIAVIESLARETAATLVKGRLIATILAERRRLSEIVSSASDGIFTLDVDGLIRSWNPAMEQITGVAGERALGRPGVLQALQVRGTDGGPARLERWPDGTRLPSQLELTDETGATRTLSCSYSTVLDRSGRPSSLVVIARDVTPDREIAELREEFDRLARAEAAQRVVVDRLQEAMMPSTPTVSGVELGVRYLPSEPSSPTGGDLYDWQVLPSGEMHVAVVDVLGHGVAATKNALSVVHALRTLALQDCPLEHMVERADTLLGAQSQDLAATVMIGRYDPRTGRLRLAAGGHPPALIVSQHTGVRQVPAAGGAIGWPGAGSENVVEVLLEPSDALVLYTDGLVESRKDIIAGEEALMRHAHELMYAPADEMAAGLLDRALAGGERRDDSLVLVLRRAPAMQRIMWEMPPDPARVPDLRREAAAWLAARGAGEEDLEDLQLICAELLSNACTVAQDRIVLRVAVEDGRARVEVEDDGPGRPDLHRLGHSLPGTQADAGRGLFIVRAISDDLSVLSTEQGSIVRASRALRDRAPSMDREGQPEREA